MPQDKFYTETKNNFGRELYGDSLYVPEEKRFPKDTSLYNQEYIVRELHGSDIFSELQQDSKFADYETIPYLTFNAMYEGENKTVFINESPYVLVEKRWKAMSFIAQNIQVFACIPFDALDLDGHNDAKIINKVVLNNHSNPLVCNQVNGRFRSPVAITRNLNHYRFDSNNCWIYNDDWFIIKMVMPATYLMKK